LKFFYEHDLAFCANVAEDCTSFVRAG